VVLVEVMKKKLIEYPELIKEWHYKKNLNVNINNISRGTNLKVWCICKKEHEYISGVYNRTTIKTGCPYCANQKISKTNNLKFRYPEIVEEWNFKKNKDLLPQNIFPNTNKKVWWKCKKNSHEWQAAPNSRISGRNNCPYCSNQKVGKDNNLNFLFPKLATEWHSTKNGKLKPQNVIAGSNKKVWWNCQNGHGYQSSVGSRSKRNTGCPYCSNKKVGKDNNLNFLFPKLATEWHPTKNGKLKPQNVVAGGDKKYWWICQKRHEWKVSTYLRISGTNCPYCSNKKVGKDNNLKFLFPEIEKEWHPNKNIPLNSNEVVYGSNKKVWWKCQNGHEWKTSVVARTGEKKTGCPFCSKSTSKPEIRIFSELQYLFKNVISREKIYKNEVDIFLEEEKIAIEYDGFYFHKARNNKDLQKNKFLKSKKIKVIRVREKPLKKIHKYDVLTDKKGITKEKINELLINIFEILKNYGDINLKNYLKKTSFQNNKLFQKYLSFYPSPIPELSLEKKHSKISKEWHYEKNYPLLPKNFYSVSGHKVWWLCKNNHEYQTKISNRTTATLTTGCPYCANKKVGKDNNLNFLFPKLATEWHPTKNGNLKSDQITPGSHRSVWWICNKKHSWKTQVRARAKQKTNCPKCFRLNNSKL